MDISQLQIITLVGAVFFGVSLSVLAHHLRIPAIAPLLIGGVLLGPEFLGFINTDSLGGGLRVIISISVATILFEGGLSLEAGGFKQARGVILRLLTVGVIVTWLATALAVHLLFGFSIPLSVLAGSLVIVTGPTVITPLLQRVHIKKNLHHILHWEGVLIDPIGVFIAILCFEWYSTEVAFLNNLGQFSLRVLIGIAVGVPGGYLISALLRRRWIPEEQGNIFVLAAALLLFGLSEMMMHEAGLLTAVVTGLVLGIQKPEQLKHIQQFKSELTEMAIGILFILLAANLQLQNFQRLGLTGLVLIAVVIFLVRPLGIWLSAIGSSLKTTDRLFLSWVAPRGVVAGSMASLFALELKLSGNENAYFLEAFAYSVIGVTIFVQGLFSGTMARLLGVKAPPKKDWLIIGAHTFARRLAEMIKNITGGDCLLVDTNADAVKEASEDHFIAIEGDALSQNTLSDEQASSVGYLLALTDNRDLNQLICEKWSETIPRNQLFRWSPQGTEPRGSQVINGIPVWQALPKPSELAYGLKQKLYLLIQSDTMKLKHYIDSGAIPLLGWHDEQLVLNGFESLDNAQMLLFQQIAHQLPFYLPLSHILRVETQEFSKLVEIMLLQACRTHPELPLEKTLAEILERELAFPTVLSNGVAVPHLHASGITRPICVLARSTRGIDLEAFDGEPSKLFFLLLSPQKEPEIHLLLLAEIAKITSDAELVNNLLKAERSDEVLALLIAFSEQKRMQLLE